MGGGAADDEGPAAGPSPACPVAAAGPVGAGAALLPAWLGLLLLVLAGAAVEGPSGCGCLCAAGLGRAGRLGMALSGAWVPDGDGLGAPGVVLAGAGAGSGAAAPLASGAGGIMGPEGTCSHSSTQWAHARGRLRMRGAPARGRARATRACRRHKLTSRRTQGGECAARTLDQRAAGSGGAGSAGCAPRVPNGTLKAVQAAAAAAHSPARQEVSCGLWQGNPTKESRAETAHKNHAGRPRGGTAATRTTMLSYRVAAALPPCRAPPPRPRSAAPARPAAAPSCSATHPDQGLAQQARRPSTPPGPGGRRGRGRPAGGVTASDVRARPHPGWCARVPRLQCMPRPAKH